MFAANPELLANILGIELGDDEQGAIPPGATVINVTPEEQAAIQRVSFTLVVDNVVLIVPM